METLHVEDFARRILLSLRRGARIEIEADFFPDLVEELAERITFGDAIFSRRDRRRSFRRFDE